MNHHSRDTQRSYKRSRHKCTHTNKHTYTHNAQETHQQYMFCGTFLGSPTCISPIHYYTVFCGVVFLACYPKYTQRWFLICYYWSGDMCLCCSCVLGVFKELARSSFIFLRNSFSIFFQLISLIK